MSDSKASEVRRVCGCAVAGVCRVFAAETRCARDCLQPLRRRDPRPPPPLHLVACWGVSAAVPCPAATCSPRVLCASVWRRSMGVVVTVGWLPLAPCLCV